MTSGDYNYLCRRLVRGMSTDSLLVFSKEVERGSQRQVSHPQTSAHTMGTAMEKSNFSRATHEHTHKRVCEKARKSEILRQRLSE